MQNLLRKKYIHKTTWKKKNILTVPMDRNEISEIETDFRGMFIEGRSGFSKHNYFYCRLRENAYFKHSIWRVSLIKNRIHL